MLLIGFQTTHARGRLLEAWFALTVGYEGSKLIDFFLWKLYTFALLEAF